MAENTAIYPDAALQRLIAEVVAKPEEFCQANENLAESLKGSLKIIFDFLATTAGDDAPLPELFVDGFDTEQIWEEIKIQMDTMLPEMEAGCTEAENDEDIVVYSEQPSGGASTDGSGAEDGAENDSDDPDMRILRRAMMTGDESDMSDLEDDGNDMGDEDDSDADLNDDDEGLVIDDGSGAEEDASDDEQSGQEEPDRNSEGEDDDDEAGEDGDYTMRQIRNIEDDFFKLDDMERFVLEAEQPAPERTPRRRDIEGPQIDSDGEEIESEEEEDEEIDYGIDPDGFTSGGTTVAKKAVGDLYIDDIRFEDLYGPKPVDTADMSSHQKRQMELMEEIEELEAQAIGDKHWTLAGEASKAARPADSALDAIMEFQQATKAAPVVTVETTIALEDMIKRRVLDEAYDDPVAPADAGPMGEKEELPELSTEKSDKGLGEIYEQEYMKSAMGVTEDDPKQPIRDEIASLMKQLFYKLDALSNFHFTPKPVVQTANVSTDVAAIDMEEIVPLAVSQAQTRAPQEVHKARKGREAVMRGDTEKTHEDRRRERSQKKSAKRKRLHQRAADEKILAQTDAGAARKQHQKKMDKVMAAPNVKRLERSTAGTDYGNSTQFFSRLQDDAKSSIATLKGGKPKKQKTKASAANQLKL